MGNSSIWNKLHCANQQDDLLGKSQSKKHKHQKELQQEFKDGEIMTKSYEVHSTKPSEETKICLKSSSDTNEAISLKSFKIIKIIGEGSYGKVYLIK